MSTSSLISKVTVSADALTLDSSELFELFEPLESLELLDSLELSELLSVLELLRLRALGPARVARTVELLLSLSGDRRRLPISESPQT